MRIAFDFDGVLCLTPFGRLAVHAPTPVAGLPPDYESVYAKQHRAHPVRRFLEYVRFGWRRIAPDAGATLQELRRAGHAIYIVTGRTQSGSGLLKEWLRRNGIEEYVADIRMAPPGLRPPQHKLAVAKMLQIDVHIDDDPRTAYHLARNGVRAFLLDHAGVHAAAGDEPPPANLTVVRSLSEFARALDAEA